MNVITWIDDVDMDQVGETGPKVAKLGELQRAGLRVPRGFAVTTAAYQHVVGSGEISEKIDTLLSQANLADELGIGEIASQVRQLVEHVEIPTDVAEQIGSAYDRLAERCGESALATAIRSSATGEDAANASFAGQFDSYLGITGRRNVIASVRDCWASLFTERGVAYRLRRGLDHTGCPMAVGVLELIEARASGVAFSVHPVTGRTDRIVMEGSWGWGEAIVGGLVVPDRAEVGKSDSRILDYVVSTKLVMSDFDRAAGAVHEVPVPEEIQNARVLCDAEVLAISAAVHTIEQYFGHAVDVEWVAKPAETDRAEIVIVQARPETVHGTSDAAKPTWDPAGYALKYAFGTKQP